MTRLAPLSSKGPVATVLAAALLILWLAPPAPAQPPAAPATRRAEVGTEIFRKTLELLRFKPVKSFAELDPHDCILIMLGDTRRLSEVPGGLNHFVRRGGAALIASDLPMPLDAQKELVETSGVAVTGLKWSQSDDLDQCYRGFEFCPYMLPIGAARPDTRLFQHPTQNRLVRVATNMPATLEGESWPRGVRPVAKLPDGTKFWAPRNHPDNVQVWLFGVAGDVDAGRIIVLADHSIFINEMMKPTDNDNVEFTANCLTYLRGEGHQRKRVLFVDDSRIYESFEVVGPHMSPLDRLGHLADNVDQKLGKANDTLNNKLNQWQDRLNQFDADDGFNRGAWRILRFIGTPRQVLVVVWILATLALVVYACYRLGIASLYKKEAAVPSLPRVANQQGPRGSLLALRHEGLLGAANLAESGRQLARDAFEAGGVVAPVPYREPAVTFKGVGWWRRFGLRRHVLRLWRLAFLNQPMHLAPYAIRALVAELEQLKADLKRGTIQLT